MVSRENSELKLCWSHDVSEKEINDFIEIMNNVFGYYMNKSLFEKKYLNNIYGSSILVLAYKEDKCVGARAFWRNDIENIKSFQPCDTAVLKEARGEGIFTKMTLKALEEIGDDVLIYNFPNDNSIPGYLKLVGNYIQKNVTKFLIRLGIFHRLIRSQRITRSGCSQI